MGVGPDPDVVVRDPHVNGNKNAICHEANENLRVMAIVVLPPLLALGMVSAPSGCCAGEGSDV